MSDKALQYELRLDGEQFDAGTNAAIAQMGRVRAATYTLRSGTHAATAGMTSLRAAMATVGFTVAPQLTGTIMTATAALRAMRHAAIATSTSFGLMVPAMLAVAGALATLSEGWKAFTAGLGETKAWNNLMDQQREMFKKLEEELRTAARKGLITREQATNASLAMAANRMGTPEWSAAARRAAELVGGTKNKAGEWEAYTQMQWTLRGMNARGLGGAERDRAELAIEIEKLSTELGNMASKWGFSQEEVDKAISTYNKSRIKEIEERHAEQPRNRLGQMTPDATALERMGFVTSTGSTADSMRRLVTFSERTATATERIAQKINRNQVVLNE